MTRRSLLQAALAFRAFSQKAPDAMAYVPSGKFVMGERETEHEVDLDGFSIAKFLVTNSWWQSIGATPLLLRVRRSRVRRLRLGQSSATSIVSVSVGVGGADQAQILANK